MGNEKKQTTIKRKKKNYNARIHELQRIYIYIYIDQNYKLTKFCYWDMLQSIISAPMDNYLCSIELISSLLLSLESWMIITLTRPRELSPLFRDVYVNHLELRLDEYQSFFWQTNIFSFSMPYSVSSLRHPHLIPLVMVAMASTK